MDITLRKATLKDARFLFDLRNDPSVEKSLSIRERLYLNHTHSGLQRNCRTANGLYVAKRQAARSATRFDVVSAEGGNKYSGGGIVSGKGYGFSCHFSRVAIAVSKPTHHYAYPCQIKSDNLSSLRSFDKAGYTKEKTGILKNSQIAEMTLFRTNQKCVSREIDWGGESVFIVAEISGTTIKL